MSTDFSSLWNAINGVISGIQSFFNGIWASVSVITNTGQGIFSGLTTFGSQLWDAIIKFGQNLGQGLIDAFTAIGEALQNAFNVFGGWINSAMQWIGSGLTAIGENLAAIGAWIHNSIIYLWDGFVTCLTLVWNGITEFFAVISTSLQTWWGGATNAINNWWTDAVKGFRNKIRDSIMASLTITATWKAAEGLLSTDTLGIFEEGGISKLLGGVTKILMAPVIGMTVGAIIDAMIPTPTTSIFPLVPVLPTFTYTPTPFSIPTVGVGKPIIETIKETVEVSVTPIIG